MINVHAKIPSGIGVLDSDQQLGKVNDDFNVSAFNLKPRKNVQIESGLLAFHTFACISFANELNLQYFQWTKGFKWLTWLDVILQYYTASDVHCGDSGRRQDNSYWDY